MNNHDYATVNIVCNAKRYINMLSMQEATEFAIELLNDFSEFAHYDGYDTRELGNAIQDVINALEKMEEEG